MFNVIHIETQNLCTRKCWYCKFGQKRRDPSITRLPDALIEKIADNLKDLDYRGRISPFGINEPLMDPRMLDIIRLFRAKCPRAFISIYSNGDLLTPELYQSLMVAGLDGIGLSVYDEAAWQRLQAYGNYPKVRLFDYRYRPEDQVENRGGEIKRASFPFRLKLPCLRPFKNLAIRSTGEVVLCCSDMYTDVVMGQVAAQRLEEIWDSENFRRYRTRLASTGRVGLPLCQTCSHNGTPCNAKSPFDDEPQGALP